jgi:hypothetical protein
MKILFTIPVLVGLLSPAMATELPTVPPELESRVQFRHSFETSIEKPEQNAIGSKLEQSGGSITEQGFLGKGFKVADVSDNKSKPLRIISESLSPDKPLTIMLWWRLDEEVPETGAYGILHLGHTGKGGYISCFVRGKGDWCGLKQPTWIYQFHNFPELANNNNTWTGRAATKAGDWHHTALTISNAKEISWYQDGQLKLKFIAKGRDLSKGELRHMDIGNAHQRQPMTIDELLVLDRALSATEIADYYAGAIKLQEINLGTVTK